MEGRSYKNKTKAQDTRALRNHRRSLDQKASRLDQANRRRNLNLLEPLEENESHSTQNIGAKKGKDPMERLEQLKKWKEQKMLKRKIEARTKKPTFKVSVNKSEAPLPAFTKGTGPAKSNPRPVARPPPRAAKPAAPAKKPEAQVKKPEAPAATSSRRVTRSSVPTIDLQKPAKITRTATRHSTGSQKAPAQRTTAAKPTTKTAAKPPAASARSSRSNIASSSKPPPKAPSPAKKGVRRSTRTSSRSASTDNYDNIEVNTQHITTQRSQVLEEETEDDLLFQYASSNYVFNFQPLSSASLLFPENGESNSAPKTRHSIRLSSKELELQKSESTENNNAKESSNEEQSTTPEKVQENSQEENAEDNDNMTGDNEVFEKAQAERKEEEKSEEEEEEKKEEEEKEEEKKSQEVVDNEEEQPMETEVTEEQQIESTPKSEEVTEEENVRPLRAICTPKSVPRKTRKSCADATAFKTPNQNAPMSAFKQRRSMSVPSKYTPNDRKVGFKMPATTPSDLLLSSKRMRSKDLRRSTSLRGLSPEECVIVLSHSPMIEMERRPYKAVKTSPVAQLDFNEDEIEAMIKEQEKTEKPIAATAPEEIQEPISISGKLTATIPEVTENTKEETPSENFDGKENVPVAENEPSKDTSPSTPIHDVPYFRNLLVSETERLNVLSEKWNKVNEETADIDDEIRGQIRTTVGQAQLLMAQRFKQFSGLVDNCEFKLGEKETTCTDLDGFWEMVFIQVEDVDMKFGKLDKLRENNWQEDKPVVKKKILKKNPVAAKGGKPAAAKPSGPSKFAAFRAKMLQQKKEEEERKKEEQEKEEQQKEEQQKEEQAVDKMTEVSEKAEANLQKENEEMKVFDAGLFQVVSPLRNSPKLSCEGGSPMSSGRFSGRSSGRSSLLGRSSGASASPMLKCVLDRSARRMSRSNPNSPTSGANISMRISRSNPGSPMHIPKTTVDLSQAVTSLRQEVLTKQLASASKRNSSFGPSIFTPESDTPQSLSRTRSNRRKTWNQSAEATSSPANRRSMSRRSMPAKENENTENENTENTQNAGDDFMMYLMPSSASPAARPSESLSSMEAEDGPQSSPMFDSSAVLKESPQVQDVDMAPPSKVSLTEEFLNMPSSVGKVKRTRSSSFSRTSSGGQGLSRSGRRKSQRATTKRHSVRFTSSTTSEDSSPLARMPLTPFNRDYPGPKVTSPPNEEQVFLFTPPTSESATPQRGSTTPATRMSKLSFKSPSVKDFTPRRSTRRSVLGSNDLITFS